MRDIDKTVKELFDCINGDRATHDFMETEILKLAEDAKRYRCFRGLSSEKKVTIAEMVGDEGYLLDHHIDKVLAGL